MFLMKLSLFLIYFLNKIETNFKVHVSPRFSKMVDRLVYTSDKSLGFGFSVGN